MLCVCLPVSLVYLLYAVEDLLVIDMLYGRRQGEVCVCVWAGGGGAIDFLQILRDAIALASPCECTGSLEPSPHANIRRTNISCADQFKVQHKCDY